MSTATIAEKTIVIVPHECGQCGVVFGMSESFVDARKKDHETWYCPNGHPRVFTGKSEAEKLRDQLAREKHWREQAEARASETWRANQALGRRLSATRGVVTRQKRKIAAGQCPCCSQRFKDLERHMSRKHPKWNPEKEAEVMTDAR